MKYSPLTIHCTSLCFDVIQGQHFKAMSHQDIDESYQEVYCLVRERTSLHPMHYVREHKFVSEVAEVVVTVLHHCLNEPIKRDSDWVLEVIETAIDKSIKRYVN